MQLNCFWYHHVFLCSSVWLAMDSKQWERRQKAGDDQPVLESRTNPTCTCYLLLWRKRSEEDCKELEHDHALNAVDTHISARKVNKPTWASLSWDAIFRNSVNTAVDCLIENVGKVLSKCKCTDDDNAVVDKGFNLPCNIFAKHYLDDWILLAVSNDKLSGDNTL